MQSVDACLYQHSCYLQEKGGSLCCEAALAAPGQPVALGLQESSISLKGEHGLCCAGTDWKDPGHPGKGHHPCSVLLCKVPQGWGLGTSENTAGVGLRWQKDTDSQTVFQCVSLPCGTLSFLNPRLESFGLELPCGHRRFLLSCKRMS